MKISVLFIIMLLYVNQSLLSQTKAELEEKRKKTMGEIDYVDNLLKTTAKEKNESMNAIKIIGNKLNLRESVIRGMRDEISLLADRIDLNTIAIEMMENDLVALKNDYARAVINSYKTEKGNPELVYILSAKDFNQGYKRLKYLTAGNKIQKKGIGDYSGIKESDRNLENETAKRFV